MAEMIIADPSFAMFDNFAARRYYDDYRSCRTVDIPTKYFPTQFSFTVAKASPFFDALW